VKRSLLPVIACAIGLLIPSHMLGQQTPAPAGGRGGAQTPAPGGRGGAQPGRGGRGGAPATGRSGAAVDLTGYWTTVVTEDWTFRMITPPKGDRRNIPVNPAAIAIVNAWDPAKDEAAGEQCKAYGAVGAMRQPGRVHVTWADENTLKIDTEAGTQTRLLHFGSASPSAEPNWQGDSVATWEYPGGRRGRGQGPGDLKVVTTHMRPGYLQKNGVPYSANAVLTEYFHRAVESNGDNWLILTAIVEDPQYLTTPFVRSTHYKRLPDNFSGWEPEACTAR